MKAQRAIAHSPWSLLALGIWGSGGRVSTHMLYNPCFRCIWFIHGASLAFNPGLGFKDVCVTFYRIIGACWGWNSRKCLCINLYNSLSRSLFQGAFVMRVTATDADDEAYGNSAKLVYSILQGQPYFSVEPETGKLNRYYIESILWNDLKIHLWYI